MSQPAGNAPPHSSSAGQVPLLVFLLDQARFALVATVVRAIVRAVAVARLPEAPKVVEGVINFRGAVVAVLDFRRRFALPAAPLHPAQHFIVAAADSRLVALRVDRATELVVVAEESIESARLSVPASRYAAGIAKLSDGLLVIHDLARFLDGDEAQRLDRALAADAGRAATGGEEKR